MKTAQINEIRKRLGEQGNDLADSALQVIVWALTLGGPIAIADKAAYGLVMSECQQTLLDGHSWYATGPDQFELDIASGEEREIANDIARSIRYLGERGLLICHPEYPSLVRPGPELQERFGPEGGV